MSLRDVRRRVTVAAKVRDEEGGVHDVEIDIPVVGMSGKDEVDGTRTRVVFIDLGAYSPHESVTIKMPPIKPAEKTHA